MKTPLMSLLVGMALFATACSGDSAGSDASQFAAEEAVTVAPVDAGSGGIAQAGPITGLLTVQPSFGYGVYVVDGTTGRAQALAGIGSVDTVDRNNDVQLANGAAYTLGAKTRDGQTFAADIRIVRIDLATGTSTAIAELGFDRETDDSESISYTLLAVTSDQVLVSQRAFGASEAQYRVFDATTGQEQGSFDEPKYEFSSDVGTCSGGIADLIGLSDGRVAGVSIGSPAIVDLGSGDIELLRNCDVNEPELGDFVDAASITNYAIVNEQAVPAVADAAALLATELEPIWGFVEGEGDLWWINANTRTVNGVDAILGGVVRFDLDTNTVSQVYSLGEHLGEYTNCGADADVCELTTIEQAQLRFIDGRLVMVDGRENGQVLVLDPATGSVTATPLERGGADFTDATMLVGDPDGVWLQVRRMTITKDDETGRSSSGSTYIERFDPTTSTITLSLAGEDIFF